MNHIYIIAEIGNTHEGSIGLAKQFIRVAKDCGVDAVKFQTHIFDCESLPNAPNPPYFKDETRKEYFDRTAFSQDQWKELKRFTEKECHLDFLSSPFSLEAVDLLENININTYKIPSGEVTNIPLLIKIAKTGKRVLLSSGMSTWEELDQAVDILSKNDCRDLIILQCTSEYPCPPENSGLNVMIDIKKRYGFPVGYSDHTMGLAVPLAAVVQGAIVIEKHFTLSKKLYGSDAKNSIEPDELTQLVSEIRNLEKAVSAQLNKNNEAKKLQNMKKIFEKSIVINKDVEKGTILTEQHLSYKKPGDGIPTNQLSQIIGKSTKNKLYKNTQLKYDDLD